MDCADGPTGVIWDITYACPLRCTHCYSESGRRPAGQVSHEDMLRIADALVSLRPLLVTFAGGEPLVVKGILQVAERISRAGVPVALYTGGWSVKAPVVEAIGRTFAEVTVSVDGADPEVHDRIRGRTGSFASAMNTLALLDEEAERRHATGLSPLRFGIDCVVMRTNFHQMEEFCTRIAPRFPHLRSLYFGAVVPTGLASRGGFADHELLTAAQLDQLRDRAHTERLGRAAPASVQVVTNDNVELMMHPDRLASQPDFRPMQVEPSGEVRAMPIYEGTVGSLLAEDPAVVWRRAMARWRDPFVIRTLRPVRSMSDWAEATRAIDYHFGSAAVRARIDRRPAYLPRLALAGHR